jgi:hypothetical protein
VWNAEARSGQAGVMNVLPGATGSSAVDRRAMIVELQGHTDDVIALFMKQRGHDRRIDPARHRNDHARCRGGLLGNKAIWSIDHSRRGIFIHGRRPLLDHPANRKVLPADQNDLTTAMPVSRNSSAMRRHCGQKASSAQFTPWLLPKAALNCGSFT